MAEAGKSKEYGRHVRKLAARIEREFAERRTSEKGGASSGPARGDQALVVGIYGPWGSGKTRWLKEVGELVGEKKPGPRVLTVPVMFNAWQFEREEHLIIPLLKVAEVAVREAVEELEAVGGAESFVGWLKRSGQMLGDASVALASGLSGRFSLGARVKVGDSVEFSAGRSVEINAGKVIETFAARRQKRAEDAEVHSPLEAYESLYFDLRRLMCALTGRGEPPKGWEWLENAPVLGEQREKPGWRRFFKRRTVSAEIEQLQALPAASGDGGDESEFRLNLLFLIDDLDRCLPEKAVEMLEAIKLFLEVPGCAFVLAVDDEMIERGVLHRYRDYRFAANRDDKNRLRAPITGAEYLEKIVHLPVRVPPPSWREIVQFIRREYEGLLGRMDQVGRRGAGHERGEEAPEEAVARKLPSESLLELLERCLPYEWRKIIRFMELFEMLDELASECMPVGRGFEYEPILLARLVLLQLFAPELYRMGRRPLQRTFLSVLRGMLVEDRSSSVKVLRENADAELDRVDMFETVEQRVNRRKVAELRARILDAYERVLEQRVDFRVVNLFDEDELYNWDGAGRLAFHYRIVADVVGEEERGDKETARGSDVGSRRVEAPPRRRRQLRGLAPLDIDDFVASALSGNEEGWQRALASDGERFVDAVLDEKSFGRLLEGARAQPDAISLRWVARFRRFLSGVQLREIYGGTKLLDRVREDPGMFASTLSTLCEAVNPPTRAEAEATISLQGLVEPKVGGRFARGYYLRGLDLEGIGERLGDASDLRESKGERPEGLKALYSVAPSPITPGIPFRGHQGAVMAVCAVGEGKLASAGADGTVRLWKVETGEAVGEPLRGHQGRVWAVCAVGEGKLASAGEDGTVRLWKVETGEAVGEPLRGHKGAVLVVCAVGEGKLASAGSDGTVRLWKVETSEAVGEPLRGHEGAVRAVCEVGEGKLAFGDSDGTVRLWNVETGKAVGEPLRGHQGPVRAVCAVGEGKLASAGDDGTVRLWNVETSEAVGEPLRGHQGPVWAVCAVGEGKLAFAGNDGTVRLWKVEAGEVVGKPLRGHQGLVWAVCAVGGGKLASAGSDGSVRLWNARTDEAVGEPLRGHQGRVRAVCAVGEGQLASGGLDWMVRLWNVETGEAVGEPMGGYQGRLWAVCALGEGKLASVGDGGTVRLWNARTGEAVGEPMRGHEGPVWTVCAVGEGKLASGGDDGTVRLWKVETGEAVGEPLRGHQGPVWAVCAVGEGKLASAGEDGTVRLWKVETGEAVGEPLRGHQGRVWAVCAVGEGKLASAGEDGTVRLWKVETGEAVGEPLRGHQGRVLAVCAVGEDKLASAGDDGTVRLWKVETGEAVGEPLRGHQGEVRAVCAVGEGKLASAGDDGTVRSWNVETQTLAAIFTPLAPRVSLAYRLTNDDWPIALTGPWTNDPEDPELYRHFGYICTDATLDGPKDPRYRVALSAYKDLENEHWKFTENAEGTTTLHLAWPTDPTEKDRLERALLGWPPQSEAR
ncbi:hypothetical protein G6O69_22320 [Pseudenhygromyxa sp. WMMC2535]|nr:hypothetical protein [Pseudenhygromyxa sp. WMMC2535]